MWNCYIHTSGRSNLMIKTGCFIWDFVGAFLSRSVCQFCLCELDWKQWIVLWSVQMKGWIYYFPPIICKPIWIPLTLPPVLRGERRFEKPLRREVGRPGFEEPTGPAAPGRKEFARADSDNWRTLREEQEEDEGETGSSWRISGPRRDGTRRADLIALAEHEAESAGFYLSRPPFTFLYLLILFYN